MALRRAGREGRDREAGGRVLGHRPQSPSCTRRVASSPSARAASSRSRVEKPGIQFVAALEPGPSRSPSDQRCARPGSLWLAASQSSCTRCCETGRSLYWPKPPQSTRQEAESSSQEERRPREGVDDGADSVAGANRWPTAISTEPLCTQLTPSSAERARREHRHPKASTSGRASRP